MKKIILLIIYILLIPNLLYAQKVGLVLSGGGAKGMTHIGIIRALEENGIPIDYIAGTSTANEAYEAWKARIPLVKIYPITAIGGPLYLEDLLRPMPFLNIMPQGNVKLSEVKQYIDAGAYAVGVGRDLYEGYSYSEITDRAKDAISKL